MAKIPPPTGEPEGPLTASDLRRLLRPVSGTVILLPGLRRARDDPATPSITCTWAAITRWKSWGYISLTREPE